MRAERLLPTRVYRFYRGEALLGRLRGRPGEDDFFPERKAFDSPFGKTEVWIVLDRRNGEAEVWAGLGETVEPERYLEWIAEQDVGRLLHSPNRISARPGDVVYVPAGVPHALDLSAHEPFRGLPPEARSFFLADRQVEATGRFAVLLVVEGEGRIDSAPACPGAAFVVAAFVVAAFVVAALVAPAAAGRLRLENEVRVLRCVAPDLEI